MGPQYTHLFPYGRYTVGYTVGLGVRCCESSWCSVSRFFFSTSVSRSVWLLRLCVVSAPPVGSMIREPLVCVCVLVFCTGMHSTAYFIVFVHVCSFPKRHTRQVQPETSAPVLFFRRGFHNVRGRIVVVVGCSKKYHRVSYSSPRYFSCGKFLCMFGY